MTNNRTPVKRTRLFATVLGLTTLLSGIGLQAAEAVSDTELEALFQEGMQALDEDRYRRAVEIFNSILSADPQLHRARLELALAYYRSFQYAEAERYAQEVLDDPNTPDNVRVTILAFLAQVRKDAEAAAVPHAWRPRVSLGYMYDSNVNAGPGSDILEVDGQSLLLTPGSTKTGDQAAVLSVGLAHTYKPGTTVNVGDRVASFLWQSEASLYHRDYKDERDFNLTVATLSTGPSLVVPRHWRAGLQLTADHISLGNEALAVFASLRPMVTWQFDRTEITWDAIYTRRSYDEAVDAGREGNFWRTGVSVGQYYRQRKVAAQAGLSALSFDADAAQYAYDGYELFAGASVRAWPQGSLYLRANYRDVQYDAGTRFNLGGTPPTILSTPARDEQETRLLLGMEHRIKTGPLDQWSLGATLEFTDNRSNVSIYDYDRRQFSVTMSRAF